MNPKLLREQRIAHAIQRLQERYDATWNSKDYENITNKVLMKRYNYLRPGKSLSTMIIEVEHKGQDVILVWSKTMLMPLTFYSYCGWMKAQLGYRPSLKLNQVQGNLMGKEK